jgi:type IV pilus assembly protein PilX
MIANYLTNTSHIAKYNVKSKQNGVTLIMVLIFIVTLSLVAAVGMRNVMSGELVAANERDRALAFQAAESAGREAIAAIETANSTVTVGLTYPAMLPFSGNAEFWRTTSNVTLATDCVPQPVGTPNASRTRFNWSLDGTGCSIKSVSKYGNADEPRYFVERLADVPPASPGGITQCWYRITSRATGLTRQADVILQVMHTLPKDILCK